MASFKEAFAKARKDGKQTFEWNGKSYNTKMKGEDDGGKRTTRPKARPKQTAPTSSPRPDRKPKVRMSATSPRAPESTSRPKARADRGTGAVTRSARPAAKPTRTATESKPQAETPIKKEAGTKTSNPPKKVSDRQANRDRAMQTMTKPRSANKGTKVKQTARVGRNPFLDFFSNRKSGSSSGRNRSR